MWVSETSGAGLKVAASRAPPRLLGMDHPALNLNSIIHSFIHSALKLRRRGVSDGSGRLIAVLGCEVHLQASEGKSDEPKDRARQEN